MILPQYITNKINTGANFDDDEVEFIKNAINSSNDAWYVIYVYSNIQRNQKNINKIFHGVKNKIINAACGKNEFFGQQQDVQDLINLRPLTYHMF